MNELVNIPISSQLCYVTMETDMEEYRRWEDNIKMDLKEIGVNVRS